MERDEDALVDLNEADDLLKPLIARDPEDLGLFRMRLSVLSQKALSYRYVGRLDEATAAAEAMTLMRRVGKAKGETLFVDAACHPQTIAVIRTRAEPMGWEVIVGDPFADLDPEAVFGALFQYPGVNGDFHDFSEVIEKLHGAKALAAMAAALLE